MSPGSPPFFHETRYSTFKNCARVKYPSDPFQFAVIADAGMLNHFVINMPLYANPTTLVTGEPATKH